MNSADQRARREIVSLLSPKEAAADLNMSERHVLRLVAHGDIAGVRVGCRWYVAPGAVAAFRERRQKPHLSVFSEEQRSEIVRIIEETISRIASGNGHSDGGLCPSGKLPPGDPRLESEAKRMTATAHAQDVFDLRSLARIAELPIERVRAARRDGKISPIVLAGRKELFSGESIIVLIALRHGADKGGKKHEEAA